MSRLFFKLLFFMSRNRGPTAPTTGDEEDGTPSKPSTGAISPGKLGRSGCAP